MFGSNGSALQNNVYGGITESHQRLFGGDRALATKDIEGAQPRKYNKHVWGNYDPVPSNIGLSIDPSKSTIKSPIFGESVQPVNRSVPNSSGLVFREQNTAANPNLANDRQALLSQSAVAEPRRYSTGHYTKSDINQQAALNERLPTGGQDLQGRQGITPPSQVAEQNIFSQPAYAKSDPNYTKPINAEKARQIEMIKEKMFKHQQVHNAQFAKVMTSKRTPDSYIPLTIPKSSGREQVSSHSKQSPPVNDPSKNLYIDKQIETLQKNPIFTKNRNFGPDSVLFHSLKNIPPPSASQQKQSDILKSFRNSQQGISSNNADKRPSNIPLLKSQSNNIPTSRQSEQLVEPLQQSEKQQSNSSQKNLPNEESKFSQNGQQNLQNSKNPSVQGENENIFNRPSSLQREKLSPFISEKPPNSAKESLHSEKSRLRSNQMRELATSLNHQIHTENNAHIDPITGNYPKTSSHGLNSQSGRIFSSGDLLKQRNEIRTALSSRGRMVLDSGKVKQTSNGDYGVYIDLSKIKGGEITFPEEKVLYQSRRDNFLKAPKSRSQSAEGIRLNSELGRKVGSSSGGVDSIQNNLGSLLNQGNKLSAIKKYQQYGVNDYNIVNNHSMVPRVESPLKPRVGSTLPTEVDFPKSARNHQEDSIDHEIRLQKLVLKPAASSIMNIEALEKELLKNQKNSIKLQVSKRSTSVLSPEIFKNEYPDIKLQKIYDQSKKMLERQQSLDGNGIKFFSGKALKNLSNINIY